MNRLNGSGKRQRMMMALLPLFSAILLVGCETRHQPPPKVITKVVKQPCQVPETFLILRSEPLPPDAGPQSGVALWVTEYVTYCRDLRGQVEAIDEWQKGEQQ